MGTMYDAANPRNIPVDASIVAGYINGRYRWTQKDWDRFPGAQKVRIQVYIPGVTEPGTVYDDGDVLDVEAGDAPIVAAQQYAKEWVAKRIAAGIRPVIYTSRSTLHYFNDLFSQVDYWVADPTGNPHLLPGTVATQYYWGPDYDLSVTATGWPRKAGLPTAKGTALPNSPCIAFECTPSGKGYWMAGADGGVFTFGDAGYFGSLGDKKLNSPIIGMKVTPSGNGYWLFAGDYGVFAFGDAEYLGHPGAGS